MCETQSDTAEFEFEDANWDEWRPRSNCEIASDDDHDAETTETSQTTLRDALAEWAITYSVSLAALSALLAILLSFLKPHNSDLPKNARTLLKSERTVVIKTGGEYYYFGVEYWLLKLLGKTNPIFDSQQSLLHLHVNIDSIPLFNSSSTALWPILGSIKELSQCGVFPIALFSSASKPTSLDDYLFDFVAELKNLETKGFEYNNHKYFLKLDAMICDAPARAFVKCIKTHNGYNCCERCMQHGAWDHKILLPDLFCPLRNDRTFNEKLDAYHHVGTSPLTQLSCGMVSSFPLDYMHLICLGVVRRLLHLWSHGLPASRLSQTQLLTISGKLVALQPYVPREFSRKPRSIAQCKQWKATELRLFLLYVGPVALKGILPETLYSHFMDLSVAMRILLSPRLCSYYLDFARKLLRYFVSTFAKLYGDNQLVYNVHSVIHLANNAQRYGPLDEVSSFKYESYLGQLKKLVRRPQLPVAQIVRRIQEGHCQTVHACLKTSDPEVSYFKQPHMEGPLPVDQLHCYQYKQYHGLHFFIAVTTGNNCCQIAGKVGVVKNILRPREEDACSGNGFVVLEE